MPHDHGAHDHHDHEHHDHDHHDHSGHDHGGHSHAPKNFGPAFALGTALNTALVLAQLVVGYMAHSTALMADAVHNAGDVFGLVLAWAAVVLARRAPSARRTYGWGRGSILAALLNAAVLLVGVGAIAVEAVRRFSDPAPVDTALVIWVALAGIVINGFTAWMFSRSSDDLNIRAAFLHMAGDAGISAGVVVAAVAIHYSGYAWLDPLTSLIIVAIIAASTWGVLRDAADLAMDAVPPAIKPDAVADFLKSLPGVVEVHDLHIWGLSTTETALTAHLVHAAPPADDFLLMCCRELSARFRIGHATLQLEDERLASACRLRPADVV